MTRRHLIGAAAAAAAAAPSKTKIPVGVATNDFREHSNQSLALELKSQDVHMVQLFFTQKDSSYWRYGQRSDLAGMTPERAKDIAAIYRDSGIAVHSLAVYATLIHPETAERNAHLDYFEAMMKLGAAMGVRTFLSEMGHYHPPGPAPAIPYDYQDAVWKAAVETCKELARRAAAHDAVVLLEPFYRSLLASAKRMRLFIEEVGSPRVRVNLDPANLLEVNDLEEMFGQLQQWIGCIHAKDRKLHTSAGVGAGKGDLDYPKFVRLSAERSPGVPLVIEYVGMKDYREALAHLRRTIREAGFEYA